MTTRSPSKFCRWCKKTKPLTDFYTHPQMGDGHLNKCKECVRAYAKKHRRETEGPRQSDLKRHRNNPARRAHVVRVSREWRKKNPEAYKAQTKLNNAVRDGKIKREPCEVCGASGAHAHHEDYSKPLDVNWLCPKHHAGHHHEVEV